MSSADMAKVYDPKDFEQRIYQYWLENGFFKPSKPGKPHFSIVIPPPNVTGVLHMGHGLNNCLQDIIIRYQRMIGKDTLWVPGSDHAGIATQNVVEKRLRKQGKSRHDLGREAFIEETWKVKEEHHTVITEQLKRIGSSCDWSRERFTLDEGLSRAVREVFVGLYEKNLIYRGNYLVNWCTSCGTALSDDEVEHQELKGKLYHIRYPFEDGSGYINIATTRPETLLGDTAVAVHPEDERYSAHIGKMLVLPLTGRTIPLIADTYVEKEFGSGAVKITPAHDPNDWEMSKRHDLPVLNILNPDGTLNDSVPEAYRGMKVKQARKAVLEDLEAKGFFLHDVDHIHQVGHCYRCNTVIEPYLSEQWFVRMRPLADKALKALEDGEICFYPKKWENTYTSWLTSIRDWCISRQLWWGHRIPVWYCNDCGQVLVKRDDPESCTCGSRNIRQDEDVLDTWFSSMLWPFSTLGWPEKTEDFLRFFPTTTLVTAFDIIFFWVARMIMISLEFLGKAPFKDILMHGLVRDKQGKKMSKSLGNGIDPLEIVDEFGADSLKFTMAFLAAQGQDVLLDKDSFKLGSKFANKIWNASRYLLMNLGDEPLLALDSIVLNDIDKWIIHRLNETIARVHGAFELYRLNDAAQAVYDFFWNEWCDWYLEATKLTLAGDEESRKRTVSLLVYLLEEVLRLMHPLLPFLTEEIYGMLPYKTSPALITAEYPVYREDRINNEIDADFVALQEAVRSVRTLRSEFTIDPSRKIDIVFTLSSDFASADFFKNHVELMKLLIGSESIEFGAIENRDGFVTAIGKGFEAFVSIKDAVDLPREREKTQKETVRIQREIERLNGKLSNPAFIDRAPAEIVDKERTKIAELEAQLIKLREYSTRIGL